MYLQLNTRFNPFTYDEMVKPLLYYQEAYDKTEAAYDTLAQQTEMWRNIANRDKSPEAFAMYQRYSNDLANAADSFSQGMTSQNRRALVGLKRRYASDIQPIATAYARQTALADEQRKAELANPTMLWERRANDMSLDDFIKNPNADYGRSVSGATLSAQVAAGASALAKEFQNNPEQMRKLVGGDYFEYVKKRGFSSEAVLAAIMNSKEASPILTNLVETAMDSTGIKGWADDATLNQAYNYARQGLWNAVGQDEAQLVQNWRAQENLQHSHAMARQASAHQMDLEKAYLTQTATPYLKSDGTVGYYQSITKNSNGTYSRTPVPADAIAGSTEKPNNNTPGTGDSKYIPGTDVPYQKIRRAMVESSQSKMKELGYIPMYSVVYTSYNKKGYKGNNGWSVGKNGDDHPDITGWAFHTNSNLITKWGNFTTNPINKAERSWVEDITKLPKEVQEEIDKLDIPDDKDFEVQRVKRDGANEGIEYDYVVYVKND